jgi:hypothetical protein
LGDWDIGVDTDIDGIFEALEVMGTLLDEDGTVVNRGKSILMQIGDNSLVRSMLGEVCSKYRVDFPEEVTIN